MANKPQLKKAWTKPELTVLVRNNTEEAVLTGCKVNHLPDGATRDNSQCNAGIEPPCILCNAIVSS